MQERKCEKCGRYFSDSTLDKFNSLDASEIEYTDNEIHVVEVSRAPKTLETIIKERGINMDEWEVAKYRVKTSEGYRKDRKSDWHVVDGKVVHGDVEDSGKMLIVPLYSVEVLFAKKVKVVEARLGIQEMLADAKEYAPKYDEIQYPQFPAGVLYEVSIPDIHFGRLAWAEESGDDYDIKIAKRMVMETLKKLLAYSKNYPVEKILLPLGNDYFNVNSKSNTTVRGTPQQEDTRWAKTYRKGREMAVEMIDQCSAIAPVDVLMISGNHDCYSADTEVLTNAGWKNYKMLVEADMVATINRHTKEVEYQPYTNLVEYDYDGEMYNFKNRFTDVLVSPNHRMLHRVSWQDDYSYSTAETLSKHSVYHFRISGRNAREDFPIDDNWLRLFAWLNTDGGIRSPISYTIYQSKRTGCDKIESVLSSLGIGYKKAVKEKAIKEIGGRILRNIPLPFTTYSLNTKHTSREHLAFISAHITDKYKVPQVLFQCSERQVDIYVSSFVDGDGTRKADNSTWAMVYGKENLLSDLQHLLVENSYSAHMNFYRDQQCRLYLVKGHVNTKMKPGYISKIMYRGKIWCLQVPNSNFITRRNGKVAIHGNSEKIFYMGDALECWYNNNPNVKVDNLARTRKYYSYGRVLLGFTHGCDIKIDRLVSVMPLEEPHLWGQSKFREWHIGHVHHAYKLNNDIEEMVGVVVRSLRSLVPADAWTFDHGLVGAIKAAEAFLWDKEAGLIAQFMALP
jgi:hypothetical protein